MSLLKKNNVYHLYEFRKLIIIIFITKISYSLKYSNLGKSWIESIFLKKTKYSYSSSKQLPRGLGCLICFYHKIYRNMVSIKLS